MKAGHIRGRGWGGILKPSRAKWHLWLTIAITSLLDKLTRRKYLSDPDQNTVTSGDHGRSLIKGVPLEVHILRQPDFSCSVKHANRAWEITSFTKLPSYKINYVVPAL